MFKFKNPYWSDKNKLDHLQRRIILHSILYYEIGEPVVDDHIYEEISQYYLEYVKRTDIEVLRRTEFWYCMFDYDGYTGFYLYDRLIKSDKKKLFEQAHIILYSYHKNGGK